MSSGAVSGAGVPFRGTSGTAPAPRLESIDGLRGITSLMIVVYHFDVWHRFYTSGWVHYQDPVLSFFFLISGFILALIYGTRINDRRDFADFLIRRVGRMWPMHLFCLALLVGWETVRYFNASSYQAFTGQYSLSSLFQGVFLIHGWGMFLPPTWNIPSWALSTELFCYFLFGLLTLSFTLVRHRILAAIAIAAMGSLLLGYETRLWTVPASTSLPWCLEGFFLGYLLCFVWQRWPAPSRLMCGLLEIASLAALVVLLSVHAGGLDRYAWLLCLCVFVYAVAAGQGPLSQVLRIKPLRWLGEISLSIYLLHHVLIVIVLTTLHWVERKAGIQLFQAGPMPDRPQVLNFGETWMMDAFTLGFFAVLIAVSALTYRLVEVPTRTYAGRLASRVRRGEICRLPLWRMASSTVKT